MTSKTNTDLDVLLEQTQQRPPSVRPPGKVPPRPFAVGFRDWAGSQVAAYRIGLVLGYLAMVFFGVSAFIAGIPVFEFTTPNPESWTPIWATLVALGGFVGSIGAIRAGSEPVTKEVKVFNRVELTGAIMLFVPLFIYAGVLLAVGYGIGTGVHDSGRISVGAGFFALGVHPTIRMLWLVFRPRFLAAAAKNPLPTIIVPPGYGLFSIDAENKPIKLVVASTEKGHADV